MKIISRIVILILALIFQYHFSESKMNFPEKEKESIVDRDSTYSLDTTANIENNINIQYTFRYYIRIYPCPIVNSARFLVYGFEYMDDEDIILRIYDVNGKFIKDVSKEVNIASFDGNKLDFNVDLGFLSKGLYIVQLISNSKMTTQKFIKL